MNRFLKCTFCLLTLIFLTACASQHQQVARFPNQNVAVEDMEKGRIYVMRHPWLWNIASHMALAGVYDGDEQIGTIAGHRGFLSWEREPGKTTISSGGYPKRGVNLTVEKGKVYYILQHVQPDWGTVNLASPASGELAVTREVVDEETGRKELSRCKPPNLPK